MSKERLKKQMIDQNIRTRLPSFLPRVVLAGMAVTSLNFQAPKDKPLSSDQQGINDNLCNVGVNIRGVRFIDRGGRVDVFDPDIDEEIGVATNFSVRAISFEGDILGSTFVDESGIGRIRGIRRQCNTTGPNSRPALEFNIQADETSERLRVVAEHNFAANVVVGKLAEERVLATSTPTRRPTSTPPPAGGPAPTETPNPAATATATAIAATPVITGINPININEPIRVRIDTVDDPKWWGWLIPAFIIAGGAIVGGFLAGRRNTVVVPPAEPVQVTEPPPPEPVEPVEPTVVGDIVNPPVVDTHIHDTVPPHDHDLPPHSHLDVAPHTHRRPP